MAWVVNFADEPIGVAFDVKNRTDTSQICVGEILPGVSQILPMRFLRDLVLAA
jgi:hypothetical protein